MSTAISTALNAKGFFVWQSLLTADLCKQLIIEYNQDVLYRKTIDMKRYRFGAGEYKYFRYPLPDIIQSVRMTMYPLLYEIANEWSRQLSWNIMYPPTHQEFLVRCRQNGQVTPTPLILEYGCGGYNTLHQDLYGEVYFPFQLVVALNQVGVDYTGGEFVMTEQIPRAQSKAIVIQPNQGDAIIFTTHSRPIKGSRGFYRANMKHGVSEIKSGNRYALGIIFHDSQ